MAKSALAAIGRRGREGGKLVAQLLGQGEGREIKINVPPKVFVTCD